MSISHILGTAAANVSHFLGTAKANVSEILGATAGFGGGGGYDSDAQAYFTALPDDPGTTFKDAWNDFVISAKADGYYSKFHALYPWPGTSAAVDAVNAKNPGTFDGTFGGTVTHDSNGITGNGSSGYMNTGFVDDTHGAANDIAFGAYSRTDDAANTFEVGAQGGSGGSLLLQMRFFGFCTFNAQAFGNDAVSNGSGLGLFVVSRTSSTGLRLQVRGANNNATRSSDGKCVRSLYFLAQNNDGTPTNFSSRNLAFGFISSGLTETEAADLDTAVEVLQDALGRGVI